MTIFAFVFFTEIVIDMKKHISLVFTLALLMAVSFGCKVGPDDPGFTFASRDGRLMGDWNLTAVVDSTVDINGAITFITSRTYNGSILTTVTPFGNSSDSYALTVSITEGGNLTTVETENGDVTTNQSYWEWLGDDKNKSQVLFNDGSMAAGIWDVQGLSTKSLILTMHTKETNVSNGNVESREETRRLTFEAI